MVFCALVFLVAGVAAAQMDAGPYHILHKKGAIYDSDTGWNLNTPPYYAGSDWAVDFIYNSQGVSILHRDGAIWNETAGWDMTVYYPTSDYATALEYLRDLTGCWNVRSAIWDFWESDPGTIGGDHEYRDETEQYILITDQVGTRIYGQTCEWVGEGWECDLFEGTVIGDHVTIVQHNSDAEGDRITTFVGLVFWDETRGCWALKGNCTGTDLIDVGGEAGGFGGFEAWKGLPCPPPDPEL